MGCLRRLVVGVFAILGIIVVLGLAAQVIPRGTRTTSPPQTESRQIASQPTTTAQPTSIPQSEPLTLDYTGPGPRAGDYAGFNVTFVNATSEEMSVPQTKVLVNVGDRDWSCQGYVDPDTGKAITGVTDNIMQALTLPANSQQSVTILCRIPDVPMDNAKVRLR